MVMTNRSNPLPDAPGQVLGTATVADATATGTATFSTVVPPGKLCVTQGFFLQTTAASSPTGTPAMGFGVAAGEDDIIASGNVSAPTTAGKAIWIPASAAQKLAAAGEAIKVGLDTAHSGGSAAWKLHHVGFFIDA